MITFDNLGKSRLRASKSFQQQITIDEVQYANDTGSSWQAACREKCATAVQPRKTHGYISWVTVAHFSQYATCHEFPVAEREN